MVQGDDLILHVYRKKSVRIEHDDVKGFEKWEDQETRVDANLSFQFWKEIERNFIVMQSTGLRDRNGVEIWESDIVKAQSVLGNQEFVTHVRWSEGGFVANGSICVNHHMLEVIGNLFQNPELLPPTE